MVAGIKTLEILDRPGAYEHMTKITERLTEGILQAGRDAGHEVTGGSISGTASLQYIQPHMPAQLSSQMPCISGHTAHEIRHAPGCKRL